LFTTYGLPAIKPSNTSAPALSQPQREQTC